jgi:hypothetical protein
LRQIENALFISHNPGEKNEGAWTKLSVDDKICPILKVDVKEFHD